MFFDHHRSLDLAPLKDGLEQVSHVFSDPVGFHLLRAGLHTGVRRSRRNWRHMRETWTELVAYMYERPEPSQDNKSFWACLRRAYPDAMTDKEQYEGVVANSALIYGAGSESTVTAIASTLAALALDAETTTMLLAVRFLPHFTTKGDDHTKHQYTLLLHQRCAVCPAFPRTRTSFMRN